MGLTYTKAKHQVTIDLPKPPEEVFPRLLHLARWWPEDVEGERVGPDTVFILKTGDSHFSKNKVTAFVPGQRLAWLTTESRRTSDGYDWSGTRFIWDLVPKGAGTGLTFTYDGVVLQEEAERLVAVCDMCIKRLYNHVASYSATIDVTNAPLEIYRRITEDVPKWWGGKDLSGRSTEINDEFIVHHPGAHYSKQRLVEVIPGKRVVWLVTDSDLSWLKNREEWTNTKMVFELSAQSHSTLLCFTHEGLVPEKECYARCSEGWDMVIRDWLYTLIMYGQAHF